VNVLSFLKTQWCGRKYLHKCTFELGTSDMCSRSICSFIKADYATFIWGFLLNFRSRFSKQFFFFLRVRPTQQGMVTFYRKANQIFSRWKTSIIPFIILAIGSVTCSVSQNRATSLSNEMPSRSSDKRVLTNVLGPAAHHQTKSNQDGFFVTRAIQELTKSDQHIATRRTHSGYQ